MKTYYFVPVKVVMRYSKSTIRRNKSLRRRLSKMVIRKNTFHKNVVNGMPVLNNSQLLSFARASEFAMF